MKSTWLVTGGAGFIGSCFVRQLVSSGENNVVNLDLLTYAGNLDSVPPRDAERHVFVHGDINDRLLVDKILEEFRPKGIVHFAAESHVDRSIDGPGKFVQTNVVGTCTLLDAALGYFQTLSPTAKNEFRFLHVSTDEVYGSLGPTGRFCESSPYDPSSPYAASKASSDLFVRAYYKTYGLPVIISHCSNNYGPYQFPEKLIPLVTLNLVDNRPIPVYGDGRNVRDWLFVDDHCHALQRILARGNIGESYNIGGDSEMANIEIVHKLCDLVDQKLSRPSGTGRKTIQFVTDRPGHDYRYAIDASKIRNELGWQPKVPMEQGLNQTVEWYLTEKRWVERVRSGEYQRERLGVLP